MKSKSVFTVFLTTILITSAHKMGAPFFECGPHGRFEYCINGNLGCVIGCHCHPGYYFDTESKVCEPNNIRMSYRRAYEVPPDPTPTSTMAIRLSPTPTPSNIIDKNVEAIAKDADDLGDWLYNQFFKTIESQVINKTEEKAPTRRTGSVSSTNTSKPSPQVSVQRRSHARRRHRKRSSRKKKHSRKKGLKKKLLRISEDNSLFDSLSGSSDSSDSSASSTSSESESSESDSDSEKGDGHRKILMINKKSPQLPSFVFMPNMETPYFPPLGLPAPPVLPMYPMVPVPPMMSMMVNTPATTAASQATEAPQTTSASTNAATTAAPNGNGNGNGQTEPPNNEPDPAPPDEQPPDESPSVARKFRKGSARDKFMKKLRDRMKGRRHELPQPLNYFPDEVNDPVLGRINFPDSFPESFAYDEQTQHEVGPDNTDVNFKYLSQLIHKMNKSEPKWSLPKPMNVVRKLPNLNKIKLAPVPKLTPKRRIGDVDEPTMVNPKDDYADLGRQIAAMVRKIDAKGAHQINVDFERTETGNMPPHAMLNDNGFSSRSYWERFARSPFKIRFDTDHLNDIDTSEKLLSLEDEVSNTATTARSLSLQQIENMINVVEKIKAARRIQHLKPLVTPEPPKLHENVYLLPQFSNSERWSNENVRYNLKPLKENMTNTLFKEHVDINIDKKSFPKDVPDVMHPKNIEVNSDIHKPNPNKHNTNVAQRFKIPLSTLLQHAALQPSQHLQINKKTQKPKYPLQNQQRSKIINYQNWGPNKGVYHYVNVVRDPKIPSSKLNKPSSYFHHQIHHFDYFD